VYPLPLVLVASFLAMTEYTKRADESLNQLSSTKQVDELKLFVRNLPIKVIFSGVVHLIVESVITESTVQCG
jgi:hypothetical protein